jgi:hypothetical protein
MGRKEEGLPKKNIVFLGKKAIFSSLTYTDKSLTSKRVHVYACKI